MSEYLIVKWLHILSSVVLVGTGFGTAFYLFFANRSGNVAAQAVVSRLVVRADTWFTTPAVIAQPLTGFWMMKLTGYALAAPLSWPSWLQASLLLYLVAGLCWLPVLWLQLRMADMAQHAHDTGTALPAGYTRYARLWEALGYPAFIAMVLVYFLMVNKPALW